MAYTTYENVANPHVTIHIDGCGQIKKRGGEHKFNQGGYRYHDDYREALLYARGTGLPVKNCSFCNPS